MEGNIISRRSKLSKQGSEMPKKSLHPELKVIRQMQTEISALRQRVIALEAEVKVIDGDVHEVRPEYLKKLEKIEKGKFHTYKNMDEFMKAIGASE